MCARGLNDGATQQQVLTEDQPVKPTRQNIVDALSWLTKDAKPGDVFWLHYSGHGLQLQDHSGRSKAGGELDEALVPLDYKTAGTIMDYVSNQHSTIQTDVFSVQEIFDRLVKPLPQGATLYAVFGMRSVVCVCCTCD